ncbi:MAG: 3-hydroxyacyl-CoA dehydrogenase NAD-binding domain-containing protein, partial [Candidatus Rokuibacteriota bacterium]
MNPEQRVCVVGTGHIGLPLAAVLADAGFQVTGYDTNDDLVTRINTSGTVEFLEDGLAALLDRHLHRRLTLTSAPPPEQDAYIITVGTPLERGTQCPNLQLIQQA